MIDKNSFPTVLTLSRVIIVPFLIVLLSFSGKFVSLISAILFSVGMATDALDGYLARRWEVVTKRGEILDPIADKLLVSASLVMLASKGYVPGWMVAVVISREITVTGLRTVAAKKDIDIPSTRMAKDKTIFQGISIFALILNYKYLGINFHKVGMVLFWIAFLYTIYSGFEYILFAKRRLS